MAWWDRAARAAMQAGDAASASRYLDDLAKAERYADEVKYLDEFFGRAPATPAMEPLVASSPRALSTAEQLMQAGLPMPSAARQLTDAGDAARAAGLGPQDAALRLWAEGRPQDRLDIPRGSSLTALRAIGDSWEDSRSALVAAAQAEALAARRQAMRQKAIEAAQYAIPAMATVAAAKMAVEDDLRRRGEAEGLKAWEEEVAREPAPESPYPPITAPELDQGILDSLPNYEDDLPLPIWDSLGDTLSIDGHDKLGVLPSKKPPEPKPTVSYSAWDYGPQLPGRQTQQRQKR